MGTLELDDISMVAGGVQILDAVSMVLQRGERRALLGPNGAGKTTLFNIASGLVGPTAGHVRLHDRDVTRVPAHKRARLGLARTFQITNLLESLSVAQNVALAVQSQAATRWNPFIPWGRFDPIWKTVYELLDQGGLSGVRETSVGELPYGVQRRLEVIVAVARPSSVILLDEPGAGLSSAEAEELMTLVFGLDPDMAVLFIDHDIDLALRLATQVSVLDRGRIIAQGPPEALRSSGVLEDVFVPTGASHA